MIKLTLQFVGECKDVYIGNAQNGVVSCFLANVVTDLSAIFPDVEYTFLNAFLKRLPYAQLAPPTL